MSPENIIANDHDDELGVSSFHSLVIDSDKPRTKTNTTKRRSSSSGRRNKTPVGGRSNRRQLRDKTPSYSDKNENLDNVDSRGSQEIYLKDEDDLSSRDGRTRKEFRVDREHPVSNDVVRESRRSKSKSSLSNKRRDVSRSHSERLNRALESLEGEEVDDSHYIRRRANESLSRPSDGISQPTQSRLRRHHSTGFGRTTGLLNNRSYNADEIDHRTSLDGRRGQRRPSRRQPKFDSAASLGGDSVESYGDGRSQCTFESGDDYEDFEEDVYGMELQTPGMVDFEEEMLGLMQRANPEVTDHLDRRVHRKREMVVYDQNMPMMTRQALLTRQASSQVRRQFFDGSNIDKKRLLLRNDSMSSHDGLSLSGHRTTRSLHSRRAPPRAKSSGLGAMGPRGYMDSIGGSTRQSESDDRRRVFRSRSTHGTQPASFNQHYQNKPNRVQHLSRKTSGDLIQAHTMRGPSRGSDRIGRSRSVQRANSATSLRRSTSSSSHVAPRKPERKNSRDEKRLKKDVSGGRYSPDDGSGRDSDLGSPYRSPGSSRRHLKKNLTKSPAYKQDTCTNINDMSNKRNRSKLHLLMYKTKMRVDMNVLFLKTREGEKPRSPIDTLRMPSP